MKLLRRRSDGPRLVHGDLVNSEHPPPLRADWELERAIFFHLDVERRSERPVHRGALDDDERERGGDEHAHEPRFRHIRVCARRRHAHDPSKRDGVIHVRRRSNLLFEFLAAELLPVEDSVFQIMREETVEHGVERIVGGGSLEDGREAALDVGGEGEDDGTARVRRHVVMSLFFVVCCRWECHGKS